MRQALDPRLGPSAPTRLLQAALAALSVGIVGVVGVVAGTAACEGPAGTEGEGEGEGEADIDDPTDPGLAGRVVVVFNTVQPAVCIYDASGGLLESRASVLGVELPGRIAVVAGDASLRFTLPVVQADPATACAATVAGGGRSAPLTAADKAALEGDAGLVACVEPGGCAFEALTPSAPATTIITLDVPLRSCRSFYDEAVEDTAGVRTPTVGDGLNRVAVGAFDVGSDVVFLDGAAPAYTMFDVVEQVASHHLVACALDRLEQNHTFLVVSTCASVDGSASALRCGASRSVTGN